MALSRLNTQQYEAATAPLGANLIIASAGTGKTSTIVGRIAFLLSKNVEPQNILLLTFTNKAAAEMVERVAEYFGSNVANKIDAGTFHAVSYRLLKKQNKKVVLKQQNELKTLFRSVMDKRTFTHIDAGIVAWGAAYLYDVYSFFQNTELNLDVEEWIIKTYPDHEQFAMIYADVCDEFEALKKQYGFINFNDLLILAREHYKTNETSYAEVLIDEYQDTNALQGTLIDVMKPPSLFCVGDYDQSIYAFNGADISIIGSFVEKFENACVHTLKKNYRSSMPILNLASKVIEHNERIYPKELEVTRTNEAEQPKLIVYGELFDQYHGIAGLIRDSMCEREEIAVIFRNNSSADGVEASLRELNIGCKRRGGMSFFDSKEIKALLDIYTLLVNEDDVMAFIHIVEYAKGIGSAIAKEIFSAFQKLGHGSLHKGMFEPDMSITNPYESRKKNHQLGLFDDFMELGANSRFFALGFEKKFLNNPILRHVKINKESAKFLYDFYKLFKLIRSIKSPKNVVEKIGKSDFFHHIKDSLATRRATLQNGAIDEKLKEESFVKIKRKYLLLVELAKPYKEHERFLNAMILGSKDLSQGEGVHLLSIHASKGLEYKEVYVCDLMDGRFPNRKLMIRGGSIEEERRLFYVAVTRAKDKLFLSYAKYDKVKKMNFVASQFLYEAGLIPKDEEYAMLIKKSLKDEDE
ncbi:MAG: ATP-dependent helicase [Campylobacterota bacterium]|nr:ATP-dependent helicase [Campylobacterota bacterium]